MDLLRSVAVALVAALCGVLIPASEATAQATARVDEIFH
jgi:DNA mismatch repair ATPase MutS